MSTGKRWDNAESAEGWKRETAKKERINFSVTEQKAESHSRSETYVVSEV